MSNKKIYTAAVLVIGNEILSGRTKDKNATWLAEELNGLGIRLREIRVVPDVEDKIADAVNALRSAFDYVFTTGGIGPTHDDITAASIAKAFGVGLEQNQEALAILKSYYDGRGEVVTKERAKMTYLPAGAELIPNPVSGAPGARVGNVYIMAGVPSIMQGMFDAFKDTLVGGDVLQSVTVDFNHPESALAHDLAELQKLYSDIDIGSYPKNLDGKWHVSIVIRGTDETRLKELETELLALNAHLSKTAAVRKAD